MIKFDLYDYPEFVEVWRTSTTSFNGDEFLRHCNYHSTIFYSVNPNPFDGDERYWAMESEEFLIFDLLWRNL